MNTTIEQQVNYLGANKFIKISNADDFPELSNELKEFLKNTGIFSDSKNYPFLVCKGKLKRYKDNFIQFGAGVLDIPFCIDISNNERIVSFDLEGNMSIDNSSIKSYIACNYVLRYYYKEIEFTEKYGEYYKNNNHKKYAQILRDMLNEVEPGIENYPTWQDELFQKELGVI
jgi:hypothetical protein